MTAVSTESPGVGELRIVSTGASPEEIAVVTAVVQGALAELGADAAAAPAISAWQRSQRAVRGSLAPGAGAWRGFTG